MRREDIVDDDIFSQIIVGMRLTRSLMVTKEVWYRHVICGLITSELLFPILLEAIIIHRHL